MGTKKIQVFTGEKTYLVELSEIEKYFQNRTPAPEKSKPNDLDDLKSVQLLTVKEITELFRIDRSTLRRWRKDYDLRPLKLDGGKVLYLKTDIINFINTKKA